MKKGPVMKKEVNTKQSFKIWLTGYISSPLHGSSFPVDSIKNIQMRKRSLFFVGILMFLLMTACNDWVDLYPENAQTSDQYWETKEDVEAVVAAGYVKLRNSVEYLYVWGEMRGNGISIYSQIDDNIRSAQRLRTMDILPSNMYAKWENMYQIINMANSVIRYAPQVVEKDPSFTQSEMRSLQSEAYFLRSLAYFYLVRTFKDVPLILEPYVRDDADYEAVKSSENVILNRIVNDLIQAMPAAKEFFPDNDFENPVNSKGRATKIAINALLADIYLWMGDYDKCIEACDAIVGSGRVGLISNNNWFANFYPGNSNESIYEIQYSYLYNQTNAFLTWFDVQIKYGVSLSTIKLFNQTVPLGDKRGLNASFHNTLRIWKYVGKEMQNGTLKRLGTENDQNFIIYRFADVLLMKAEALVMKGEAQYEEATEIVARIRTRAGITEVLTPRDTEMEMLVMILDERGRELFSEGKRWFDLLRVARRNDYAYINYFIEQVTSVIPLNNVAIVRSKLMDFDSHYLPIHQDEINNNRLLEQNPYYSSLGN